jgi:hypothetical protein
MLLTDKGKALVQKYEASSDAQSVYKELVEHSMKSTKASIDKSDLLQYITAAHIGDGSYESTTHSFILHWQDCIRKYESQADAVNHFSDASKTVML